MEHTPINSLESVRARIEYIRSIADDSEVAHSEEDDLQSEFIAFVADNPHHRDLADMAALVLTTASMTFARWWAYRQER